MPSHRLFYLMNKKSLKKAQTKKRSTQTAKSRLKLKLSFCFFLALIPSIRVVLITYTIRERNTVKIV